MPVFRISLEMSGKQGLQGFAVEPSCEDGGRLEKGFGKLGEGQ
jgi:hypothetical protein